MKKFLLFMGGYDYETAKMCSKPNQFSYTILGFIVLIVVSMSVFSGYHIAQSVTHSLPLAAFFAIFWGFVVFGIERGVIALFDPESKKKYVSLYLRMFFSIAISLLLSTPFVLMLFNESVNQQLNDDKKAQISICENNYQQSVKTKDSLLAFSYADVKLKQQEMIGEAEGKSGTHQKGLGEIFSLKQSALDSAKSHYNTLQSQSSKEKFDLLQAKTAELENIEKFYANDFLAQINALFRLIKSNLTMMFYTILVFLVLLGLDILGIILKTFSSLGSPNDPYYILKKHYEGEKLTLAKAKITHKNQVEMNNLSVNEPEINYNAFSHFKYKARDIASVMNGFNEYSNLLTNQFVDNEEALKESIDLLNKLKTQELSLIFTKNASSTHSPQPIQEEYKIYIGDSTGIPAFNPFAVNNDIILQVSILTASLSTENEKFNAIFDWVHENISYLKDNSEESVYKTAIEVFKTGSGVCGEQSAILIAMLRQAGIMANYTHVYVDYSGEEVLHACAAVKIDGQNILADIAYHNTNVKHLGYTIEKDNEVIEKFRQWNLK